MAKFFAFALFAAVFASSALASEVTEQDVKPEKQEVEVVVEAEANV